MSTIYDNPCPPPTCEEHQKFVNIYQRLMHTMTTTFGPARTEVLLDAWHINEIASALTNGWERGKRQRILDDLNEAIRLEHEQEDREYRWVLVPTPEP